MSDNPDFVTLLHRLNGAFLVALMRFSGRADDYEPVKFSRSLTEAEARTLAGQWAKNLGVEFRP